MNQMKNNSQNDEGRKGRDISGLENYFKMHIFLIDYIISDLSE